MSLNSTLHALHNYLSTAFILRNKPMFKVALRQNWIYSVKFVKLPATNTPIFRDWLILDLTRRKLTKIIESTFCHIGPIFQEPWAQILDASLSRR